MEIAAARLPKTRQPRRSPYIKIARSVQRQIEAAAYAQSNLSGTVEFERRIRAGQSLGVHIARALVGERKRFALAFQPDISGSVMNQLEGVAIQAFDEYVAGSLVNKCIECRNRYVEV